MASPLECEQGDTRGPSRAPLTCTQTLRSDALGHRQKAAQFLREAEKNRRQIEKLEKEISLSVQCRKNGWADVCGELDQYKRVLEDERHADKMNLQMQLLKIHGGVKKFQRQLTDVKTTPEFIGRLQEIMSEVESSITAHKEEQRSCVEELLKEDMMYRQEITAYEKKMEIWSLAFKPEPKLPTAPAVKTKPPDSDVPAEVREMDSFLQKTGGPYGGWDQYDHQAFLKIWTKHRGHPAYRKEAKLYLPSRTMEDIEEHEDWHRKLINLQDRKREAIQRWKAGKHRELQSRIQSQEETERREKVNDAQRPRTEEEKRETAQRLEVWREEKRRKEEEEEQQRVVEEMQKRRREKEQRRRQLEVKLTVEEQLRLRREEEEEQERRRREEEQREIDERRREAAKGIKRFNERDLHKLEEKLQEKQLREKEEAERQRRIAVKLKEKVDCHVSRDPSRLTHPTKGWEERLKHVGPSGDGPLPHMFHRAVPTWRQGL